MSDVVRLEAHQEAWDRMQTKTFVGWANGHLRHRSQRIDNLATDLADGHMLLDLMEVLTDMRASRGRRRGEEHIRVHKIENVNFALKAMRHAGIDVTLSAENIVDGNVKLILGLLFALIRRFHISVPDPEELSTGRRSLRSTRSMTTIRDETQDLLAWTNETLEPYDLRVDNFDTSFQNGSVFCALVHSLKEDTLDWALVRKASSKVNMERAFDLANEHFDIPKLLSPDDLTDSTPDSYSVMTYVSYFRRYQLMPPAPPNEAADSQLQHSPSMIEGLLRKGREQSRTNILLMAGGTVVLGLLALSLGVAAGVVPDEVIDGIPGAHYMRMNPRPS